MKISATITGIAATLFALSGMAQSPEETSGFLFKPERRLLLEKFNKLAAPTLDDRLLTLSQILATYPPAPAKAENFGDLLKSPDLNESIRGQFCLTVAKFNNNPDILTHDGLGSQGDADFPALAKRLGLANTLFTTASNVCGYAEPLVPFRIEQEDNSPPEVAPPPQPPEKPEPAPVRGFVMMA